MTSAWHEQMSIRLRGLVSLLGLLAATSLALAGSPDPRIHAGMVERSGARLTSAANAAHAIDGDGRSDLRLLTRDASRVRRYDFSKGRGRALELSIGGHTHHARTVLFDLDGTVADTRRAITSSIEATAQEVGLGLSKSEIARLSNGQSYDRVAQQLLPRAESSVQQALARRLSADTERREQAGEASVYAGMRELMLSLRRRGIAIGAATSRPTERAISLLDTLDLHGIFEALVGAEVAVGGARSYWVRGAVRKATALPHKPAPDPLLEALRLLDGYPGEAVYVGDTASDIAAAHHAGFAAIAITHGLGDPAELARERPSATVDSGAELTALLLRPARAARARRSP